MCIPGCHIQMWTFWQDYVGLPDNQRFPLYFSLDVRLYREFSFHIPRTDRAKKHKFRLGVYSTDLTNRQNPHDVFNNVTFSQFWRLCRLSTPIQTGLVLDFIQ